MPLVRQVHLVDGGRERWPAAGAVKPSMFSFMDDWAVDQFWHLVWDLSVAAFGLPGAVNLSELTGTVGFV